MLITKALDCFKVDADLIAGRKMCITSTEM